MPRNSAEFPHVLDYSTYGHIEGSHLSLPSIEALEALKHLNTTYGIYAWEVKSREPYDDEWSLLKACLFKDQCRYNLFHRGTLTDSWRIVSPVFTGETIESIVTYMKAFSAGYRMGWKDSMNQINTEANTGEKNES